MKECVTHHHACDCREAAHKAEIERLRAEVERLKEENDQLRFDIETEACGKCWRAEDHRNALLTARQEERERLDAELKELREWREHAFLAHPNIDLDIAAAIREEGKI